ncbi:hypothetical protein BGZ83_004688 [Gryganskiella cystojenkinii]|nr:hypothetical protein BGZ83_004688 [Gryganskiella cystojenkinii]
MSHYNGESLQEPDQRAYSQQSAYDYDNDDKDDQGRHPNSYLMEQHMTPQQRCQEDRQRQAETPAAEAEADAETARHGSSAAIAAAAAATAGTRSSPWLNKQTRTTSRWKTIAWATFGVLLLALAGFLAWYFAAYKKNQPNSESGKNTNGIKGGGGGGGAATGPNIITPNGTVVPNTNYPLKRVFYGMAYVPIGAVMPGCYNTQESVDQELQLVVQTTKRVRLYGTDCKVLHQTLDAIQRLKLDLKVVVGIWIDRDATTFTRQAQEFYDQVAIYGWSNILGVSVGNEVLFDGYQPLHVLQSHIAEVKAKVVALGHPEIPVFTSELESKNKPPLTTNEDKAGVNLHPFFSGVPVENAAAWFWQYLKTAVKPTVGINPTTNQLVDVWVTEVGWPTFPASSNTNASIPSIPNLQHFIDTWLCEANKQQLPYYYFEFFDAPWKIWPGSAVEGFWGLLTIDRKLKVKLPDCLAS